LEHTILLSLHQAAKNVGPITHFVLSGFHLIKLLSLPLQLFLFLYLFFTKMLELSLKLFLFSLNLTYRSLTRYDLFIRLLNLRRIEVDMISDYFDIGNDPLRFALDLVHLLLSELNVGLGPIELVG
jgi:hypothetical protein